MDFEYTEEEETFRKEVQGFLDENLPPRDQRGKGFMSNWLTKVREKRWVGFSWPPEVGGGGGNLMQQVILKEEMSKRRAPPLGTCMMGLAWVGPAIIQYGTEEQKQRFIPDILDSKYHWCTGYSEPNVGSDLAALQCKAVRDGDHYVINGTKIWTSDAHHSDWLFGVFRTDTGGKKQHGITFLMLDLQSPGITITPIITYDDTHEVNQVFFEDVRVPATQRLGEEHQGWTVAKYLLGLERFGTAEVSRTLSSFDRLKTLLASVRDGDKAIGDDPQIGRRLTQIGIELRALELTEQRFLFGEGGADAMGAEASMLKVCGTEVQQMVLELTMDALGAYAQLDVGDLDAEQNSAVGPEAARYAARMFFNYRKTSIYSGSNEIQVNIIAKHVLGLT